IYLNPQPIIGFHVDQTSGLATVVPGSPFTWDSSGSGASGMAADPKGRFLYPASSIDFPHGFTVGKDQIAEFKIDRSSGGLAAIAGSPIVLEDESKNDHPLWP